MKAKQVRSEEVVGVTEIYQKLETLNRDVRNGAKVCFSVATLLGPQLIDES